MLADYVMEIEKLLNDFSNGFDFCSTVKIRRLSKSFLQNFNTFFVDLWCKDCFSC